MEWSVSKIARSQKESRTGIKHTFFEGSFVAVTYSQATDDLHDMDNTLQNSWTEFQMTKNPVISLENFI